MSRIARITSAIALACLMAPALSAEEDAAPPRPRLSPNIIGPARDIPRYNGTYTPRYDEEPVPAPNPPVRIETRIPQEMYMQARAYQAAIAEQKRLQEELAATKKKLKEAVARAEQAEETARQEKERADRAEAALPPSTTPPVTPPAEPPVTPPKTPSETKPPPGPAAKPVTTLEVDWNKLRTIAGLAMLAIGFICWAIAVGILIRNAKKPPTEEQSMRPMGYFFIGIGFLVVGWYVTSVLRF